jgi:hypothetical protein
LQVAHFKLSYSRAFILHTYPQQTHEMLCHAHNHAFRVLGGVPRRGIYDNMRTAVDKVGRGKERQVNARFSAMVSHFLFEAGDAGPKGRRKMLGMPPWGVDRLLEIVDGMNVSEEKLRDPLVLLVSSRRVPSKVGFTVSQSHGGREGRTWTLPWGWARGMLFIDREHLRACPEAEANFRNAGGRSEPASRGGRGHHIAEPINNVEMDRVAFGLTHPAYGWLTGAAGADHRPIAPDPRLEHFSVPRNSAGSPMKRCTLGDKDLTLSVIGVRR